MLLAMLAGYCESITPRLPAVTSTESGLKLCFRECTVFLVRLYDDTDNGAMDVVIAAINSGCRSGGSVGAVARLGESKAPAELPFSEPACWQPKKGKKRFATNLHR